MSIVEAKIYYKDLSSNLLSEAFKRTQLEYKPFNARLNRKVSKRWGLSFHKNDNTNVEKDGCSKVIAANILSRKLKTLHMMRVAKSEPVKNKEDTKVNLLPDKIISEKCESEESDRYPPLESQQRMLSDLFQGSEHSKNSGLLKNYTKTDDKIVNPNEPLEISSPVESVSRW